MLTRPIFQAWNAYPRNKNIVSPTRFNTELSGGLSGGRRALLVIRYLIGAIEYQSDATIVDIMRRQKGRVQDMLATLDTQLLAANPPSFAGMQGRPWQSKDLASKWHTFMTEKFYLAQTKTYKAINEYLPMLQNKFATQDLRDAAEEQPGDSDDDKKRKIAERALIADIDALSDRLKTLRPWTNPF